MTKLIPLDAVLLLPQYDSDGEPSGMFDHKIFVKLDAIRATPAIDPAAIREAALREAAGLIADMSRIITHTDEDLGTLTGRNLIDPRKAASAIIALIGEKK